MQYFTVMQSPMFHQMTLEEFLFGGDDVASVITTNKTNTRTYEFNEPSDRIKGLFKKQTLIRKLEEFNNETESLRAVPRHDLYSVFYIPKKSGGLRKITAPNNELSEALRKLKKILENDFKVLYHTSAFAYVKGRSTIDCVKRHQQNESKWFAKYDLSDFFGSTTLDFVMDMFSQIFPFSVIVEEPHGREELRKALELGFLDGGLPQGTPLSPLITNVMMIPIDYHLSNKFREFDNQKFIYTRYADDIMVSSKYDFNFRKIEWEIVYELNRNNSPFRINTKKTRYGSSSGSNWNLGVMLNKDNEITIGSKKKRQFEAMLSSYIMDHQKGVFWDVHDIQVMDGYRAYYKMVEGETIDRIIGHINQKFGVNVEEMIRQDLKML